jgi:hypothetical protein
MKSISRQEMMDMVKSGRAKDPESAKKAVLSLATEVPPDIDDREALERMSEELIGLSGYIKTLTDSHTVGQEQLKILTKMVSDLSDIAKNTTLRKTKWSFNVVRNSEGLIEKLTAATE